MDPDRQGGTSTGDKAPLHEKTRKKIVVTGSGRCKREGRDVGGALTIRGREGGAAGAGGEERERVGEFKRRGGRGKKGQRHDKEEGERKDDELRACQFGGDKRYV